MEREQFEKAIAIDKDLDFFRKHKEDLGKSQIQFGGCLIFQYNGHYPKVNLIDELFGGNDFFQKYMENLDAKIQSLEEDFANL